MDTPVPRGQCPPGSSRSHNRTTLAALTCVTTVSTFRAAKSSAIAGTLSNSSPEEHPSTAPNHHAPSCPKWRSPITTRLWCNVGRRNHYLVAPGTEHVVVVHESEAAARVRVDRLAKSKASLSHFARQERIVRLLDEADAIRKLRSKADRRTAAPIPALFHEMFGVPITNPMGRPRAVLEDVIHAAQDGPSREPALLRVGRAVPLNPSYPSWASSVGRSSISKP